MSADKTFNPFPEPQMKPAISYNKSLMQNDIAHKLILKGRDISNSHYSVSHLGTIKENSDSFTVSQHQQQHSPLRSTS